MTDDGIELPNKIQELVDTCAVNCCKTENHALDMLCSVEIPLFSVLRELSAQKCYSILARMRDWFGSTPRKEHYLCLIMVTDYISCSFNNKNFYGTFLEEKKDTFYESFFIKLLKEWRIVFHKMPIVVLPSLRQFELLRNSLRVAIARFPNNFMFKWILSDIMSSCDQYGLKLQKHLSDLKTSQESKMKANYFHKSLPVSSSSCSSVIPLTNVPKSKSVPIPYKPVQDPIVLEAKSFIYDSKNTIAPPNITVIGDSPVEVDKAQSKLGNITNVVSVPSTRNLLPKKLNAFDILMRKKVIKIVS